MKKLTFTVVLAVGLGSFAAQNAQTDTMSSAVRKSRVQQLTGGFIDRESKGSVAVINTQKTVPVGGVEEEAEKLARTLRIAIRMTDGSFSLPTAARELKVASANAAVFLVDDQTLPMSLVAQEAKWGVVNVAALKADNPTDIVLQRRLRKMFLRTAILALGGAVSANHACVMQNVTTLADLDAIIGTGFEPSYLTGMSTRLNRIGVTQKNRTTYFRACQEGWAPQPTNEFQKAIWDKVHAMPTEPIKVKFDPAAQKGKVTK